MKNAGTSIAVLMATYNGERFVAAQLDSLLVQTMDDFRIYIRDDCSTDETFSILKMYQERYPEKIFLSRNDENSGSGKFVFFELMREVEAAIYFLCDQDDVWEAEKIEVLVGELWGLGEERGDVPILIHSDGVVVDEELGIIDDSLIKRMRLEKVPSSFGHALSQNVVTGCTAVFNHSLKEKMGRMPDYFIMHDWWFYLVASCFGVVKKYEACLIKYRIHGKNAVGADDIGDVVVFFRKLFRFRQNGDALVNTYRQARVFREMYADVISEENLRLLNGYVVLGEVGIVRRFLFLVRNDLNQWPFYRFVRQVFFG